MKQLRIGVRLRARQILVSFLQVRSKLVLKLGKALVSDALSRLARKVAADPAARNPRPEFLAVIVGAGEYAHFDKDLGVYVLPITCLGA